MSRGFRVNFDCPELRNVLRNMERYNTRTAVKIEQAVSASTKAIGKGSRQRIPVDTGDLKRSVRTSFDVRKIQGTVKVKQYYAHFIELGVKASPSNNIPARPAKPFLKTAFEAEKDNLIRNIRAAVMP